MVSDNTSVSTPLIPFVSNANDLKKFNLNDFNSMMNSVEKYASPSIYNPNYNYFPNSSDDFYVNVITIVIAKGVSIVSGWHIRGTFSVSNSNYLRVLVYGVSQLEFKGRVFWNAQVIMKINGKESARYSVGIPKGPLLIPDFPKGQGTFIGLANFYLPKSTGKVEFFIEAGLDLFIKEGLTGGKVVLYPNKTYFILPIPYFPVTTL